MIQDLSQTLRAILTQPGLPSELSAAHIVFDRPGDTFNPSQTVIDLFLYDLRENLELRSNDSALTRVNGAVPTCARSWIPRPSKGGRRRSS